MKESIVIKTLVKIEAALKFPNLKKGEIGIQIGFDLSSKNLTSDVFRMNSRNQNLGKIIAIDPDPFNHSKLQKIVDQKKLNIQLIQRATYSKKTTEKLILGTRSSYNKIEIVQGEKNSGHTDKNIEVEIDTLDNIIKDLGIDYSKIRHICITNNGAEYHTLLGMDVIFEKCKNLNLTIASGRPNKMGEINGQRDHKIIMEFLKGKGFKSTLVRNSRSFWRGFVISLLVKRKWIFHKKTFGLIMSARGERKLKFYQWLY